MNKLFVLLALLTLSTAAHADILINPQIVVNGLNLASLLWFIAFSHVVFPIGLAMGACSVVGAVLGSRLIRKGGNRLIRRLFLGLLVIEIGRFTFGLF